jgi:hypothetical protein
MDGGWGFAPPPGMDPEYAQQLLELMDRLQMGDLSRVEWESNLPRRLGREESEQNEAALRRMLGGSYTLEEPRDLLDLFNHVRVPTPGAPSQTSQRALSGLPINRLDLPGGQSAFMLGDDYRDYYRMKRRLRFPWMGV